MPLRETAQELYELGVQGTAFRVAWEVRTRLPSLGFGRSTVTRSGGALGTDWTSHLPFEDPFTVAREMRMTIGADALRVLRDRADDATGGRVFCFGRRSIDFGSPINWHRNPATGLAWKADATRSEALADRNPGDVKDCWEVARFPHAYHLARAAAFFPERAESYAGALLAQMTGFLQQNPFGLGIHWASGQETGVRLLAWLFATDVLLLRTEAGAGAAAVIAEALLQGASHIDRHLDFARIAVYNNHLLSEALSLFGVGALLPSAPTASRWRKLGRGILDEEAERQFYADGGYIQQSHNYHRVALQYYLWACVFARSRGDSPSPGWLRALERSLDFLYAHQSPVDGRLPNYGANDGAMPSIVSTCDFSDMRPVLQTVSLLVRGERIYDRGPWDEAAAWFLGARMLDAPVRVRARTSASFPQAGFHVLRGADPSTFATFRCGTLRDRFSQIDMLHLDVWWKGQNVFVDPGTYRYGGSEEWHEHFMRTGSHNSVMVDGRDQMLHFRRFKVLYWTQAKLLRMTDRADWALCEGEHYGYRRHAGACVHRRTVLFIKPGLWVVVDRILGAGEHVARLHWLAGEYDWQSPASGNGIELKTPLGPFTLQVFDFDGAALPARVSVGLTKPIEGWFSRYYGEKVPVPSIVAEQRRLLPATTVSVLSGLPYDLRVGHGRWCVRCAGIELSFCSQDGALAVSGPTR